MMAQPVLRGSVVSGRRKPLHITLAQRLKKARVAIAIDRAPLSVSAGLSHGVVAGIEEGRMPTIDTVERLARALNVSPCFLAFGVEGMPLPPSADLCASGCGVRLQQLREARALSKLALGRAAGIAGSNIFPIESGRTFPSVATIEQIASALGCSPCWLAYSEGPNPLADPQGAAAELQAVKYRPPRSPRKPPAPRRGKR